MSKEQQILTHIKRNPYISQQELAELVGLSRPAVANYIKSLITRGEIKGRAYILNDKKYITCIGGANIDRKAMALEQVSLHSSNPVTTSESYGGVSRNVAENLSRLGMHTRLLTTIGDDKEGQAILEKSQQDGIDIRHVWTLPTQRTGTYTALIDTDGELIVSLADMGIYDHLTPSMLEERWGQISDSQAIFVDTNISAECLSFLMEKCKAESVALYIDPVSIAKTKKLPKRLDGTELILPNREEAELLADMEIFSVQGAKIACQHILDRGAKQVIITMGADGVFYASKEESGHVPAIQTEVVDVTGAGDAFAASIIYGLSIGQNLEKACQLGVAAASLTLQTEASVALALNQDYLEQVVKESS
ncbi:PfkB family carbohydrate kinase [Radiobacillus deserti]|uniref:Winged helix-turn-helix transcriptional regulator n=1 Tax=Radiobacillus deserti TaxID=2594883 RepID=A0A516KDU5_9BACI|nr:PfkB family carbohydrate kinase [Radiobacillus deserti]QDP39571.1 winged helix-turn-helix transcriptional regulator [Radiobacillus deserti]